MKNIILLLIAVIAVFAVSGCTGNQATGAFAGGNEGLALSFLDLPDSVFTESVFDINVLVQNKGEADVPYAYLTINNANTLGLTAPFTRYTKPLTRARKIENQIIAGDASTVSWQKATFVGVSITEKQSPPFSIDICYPYETTAVAMACAGTTNKICQPVGDKSVQSSGAPIKITKISQVAAPNNTDPNIRLLELAFTIDVENKGSGAVYDSNSMCSALQPLEQKDIVEVKSMIFNNVTYDGATVCQLDEKSKPTISLADNKGAITCKIPLVVKSDYEAQLSVKLSYVYINSINGAITVIPTPGV